jgi:hypothetical protein
LSFDLALGFFDALAAATEGDGRLDPDSLPLETGRLLPLASVLVGE